MNMKRLYIIIVALLSVCYIYAQERIYVHRSNGNIEAISLDQLDSLSFITTKAHLQITADNDTVRVGEDVDLYSNIVEGSVMNVKWGTRTSDLLYVYGSYNTGYARGMAPGQAEVQAVCDEVPRRTRGGGLVLPRRGRRRIWRGARSSVRCPPRCVRRPHCRTP